MEFRCMFANLAVGVGIALKLENAQNVEKSTHDLDFIIARAYKKLSSLKIDGCQEGIIR